MDPEFLAALWYDLHSPVQKALAADHGMGKADFVRWALGHCHMEPLLVGGEVVGVLALNGDSLHVAVRPEAKGRWLRQLQRFIEKQGRDLVCVTATADRAARTFIERAGCELVEEKGAVARYSVVVDRLWFRRTSWAA